jgi:hypothetical protein
MSSLLRGPILVSLSLFSSPGAVRRPVLADWDVVDERKLQRR